MIEAARVALSVEPSLFEYERRVVHEVAIAVKALLKQGPPRPLVTIAIASTLDHGTCSGPQPRVRDEVDRAPDAFSIEHASGARTWTGAAVPGWVKLPFWR